MKIIFLDIDGVINLVSKAHDEFGQLFHEPWVKNLDKVIKETKAKIVISSTWRISGLLQMQAMWDHRKLPGEVIDVTPSFRFAKKGLQYTIPRGCEIESWLDNKGFCRINWDENELLKYVNKSGIENYVIFDDDSDMLYNQREHFVQTSRNHTHQGNIEGYGLTMECAKQAIKILNTPINEIYYPR
jgi:hypothetical protein